MRYSRVTVDSGQMGGVPGIRDLRIPIATIAAMAADGMPVDEIRDAYPDIEKEDVKEALYFTADEKRGRSS